MRDGLVTVLLGGDVMLGRGVDQILPHPGDPRLWERYIDDARRYVGLAESVNGPVPRPAGFEWPWGDALPLLDELGPDVRLLNLETAVTTSEDAAPGKAVHYRMHPDNVACLQAIRPDAVSLANNHLLDFGRRGLEETLSTRARAGIPAAGAGADAAEAARPVVTGDPRVVFFAFGTPSSGVPVSWAAGHDRPGVWLVHDFSARCADQVTEHIRLSTRPGDLVIVSVHWGSNWGYDVPRDQARFAHRLIDGGVHVVFGHSSHHPRPIEVHKDRLVLYGCGDLVDDYEGIGGYEQYRDDLRLLWLASLDPATGRLVRLRMATMRSHRMRLRRASYDDTSWMRAVLDRTSRPYGVRIETDSDDLLSLRTG
ncbi:MAG TPA: CapA family protein [Kribbellaceae bacterium]